MRLPFPYKADTIMSSIVSQRYLSTREDSSDISFENVILEDLADVSIPA